MADKPKSGKTAMSIDDLAKKMGVPTPYLRLKIGRYGKDQKAVLASIRRDLAAVAKIAKDLEIDKTEAQRKFFEQLLSYRDQFDNWNAPVTPEDLVIGGFKKLVSKQLCIEKPVLAMVLDVGEPRKSSRNSTFRWINLLVENDIAGEPWKMVRTIHWGQLSSGITSGSSVFVTIEDQGGFNTLTNISKSSRPLPETIPGDPRRRVMNLASSFTLTSRAKQEGKDDTDYVFVTVLAERADGGSEIIQGTSVKVDRWQNAPHGVVLDTLIFEKSDSGSPRCYVQDWQLSQDQNSIPMPSDIPVIFDLSPESLAMYLDEWVILDGLAINIAEKEGANGNFDVIGLQSFETETSVIVRHNAWIQEGLIEERIGMRYFTVPRIRILTFLSTYEVNNKTRLSRNAVAIWGYAPDEVPENEGDYEEIDLSSFGTLETPEEVEEATEEATEEEEGQGFEGLEEVEITDEVEVKQPEPPKKRLSVKEYAEEKAKQKAAKMAAKKEEDKVIPPTHNMTPNAKKEAPEVDGEDLDNLGRPFPKQSNKLPAFFTKDDKKGGEKPADKKPKAKDTAKSAPLSPEELKRIRELKSQAVGGKKEGAATPTTL